MESHLQDQLFINLALCVPVVCLSGVVGSRAGTMHTYVEENQHATCLFEPHLPTCNLDTIGNVGGTQRACLLSHGDGTCRQ